MLWGNAPSILRCYSVNKRACFRPTAFEKGDTDGIAATFNQTEKWTGSTKGDFTQRFTCRLECYWSWTTVRQAHSRTHTENTHTYACYSLLRHGDLGLALRYWLRARLETKSIALSLVVTLCHTHTSICGKQYICSPDYARPGLLLQMVVASRNVTFDLTFHMEQEFNQVNDLFLRTEKRTNEEKMCDCLCGIYYFNTIYLFR